jgi:putative flippase GtrA
MSGRGGQSELARAMRHYGGFVAAGLLALAVDAAVLTLLTHTAGWSPFAARIPAIALAMIASWLVNRTVTFPTTAPATLAELGRFAAVSWLSQLVNYAVFASLLLARPDLAPIAALVLASGVSMIVSYLGFRFGVFGAPRGESEP